MRRYEPLVPHEWYAPSEDIPESLARWDAAHERARRERRFEQGFGDLGQGFGIEFVQGAFQALNLLHFFFQTHAITDRSPLLDPDTFNISCALYVTDEVNYFPQFPVEEALLLPQENVHLTQNEGTKPEICKRLGIQTIIEDNAETAHACADAGIRTIVLARPWNTNMQYHPLIDHVDGWQEACNLLSKMESRNTLRVMRESSSSLNLTHSIALMSEHSCSK